MDIIANTEAEVTAVVNRLLAPQGSLQSGDCISYLQAHALASAWYEVLRQCEWDDRGRNRPASGSDDDIAACDAREEKIIAEYTLNLEAARSLQRKASLALREGGYPASLYMAIKEQASRLADETAEHLPTARLCDTVAYTIDIAQSALYHMPR